MQKHDILSDFRRNLREDARKLLQQAFENEVNDFLNAQRSKMKIKAFPRFVAKKK